MSKATHIMDYSRIDSELEDWMKSTLRSHVDSILQYPDGTVHVTGDRVLLEDIFGQLDEKYYHVNKHVLNNIVDPDEVYDKVCKDLQENIHNVIGKHVALNPSKYPTDMTDKELEAEIDHPNYTFLFACIDEFSKRYQGE